MMMALRIHLSCVPETNKKVILQAKNAEEKQAWMACLGEQFYLVIVHNIHVQYFSYVKHQVHVGENARCHTF